MDERLNLQNIPIPKKDTDHSEYLEAVAKDNSRISSLKRSAKGLKSLRLHCAYCEKPMSAQTSRKRYCSDRCRKWAFREQGCSCYFCRELYSNENELTTVAITKQDHAMTKAGMVIFRKPLCISCLKIVMKESRWSPKDTLLRNIIIEHGLDNSMLSSITGVKETLKGIGMTDYNSAVSVIDYRMLGYRKFLAVLKNTMIDNIVTIENI